MMMATTRSTGQKFTTCDGIPSEAIFGTAFDAYYVQQQGWQDVGMSVVLTLHR
jgi:hypothetical protein